MSALASKTAPGGRELPQKLLGGGIPLIAAFGAPERRRMVAASALCRNIIENCVQHFVIYHKRQHGSWHPGRIQNRADCNCVVHGIIVTEPDPTPAGAPADFPNLDPISKIPCIQVPENLL